MIKTETIIRDDGVELTRTYSDAGFLIERDGVRYSEAIDPADKGRVYIETDEEIPDDDGTAEQVLNILLGGDDV